MTSSPKIHNSLVGHTFPWYYFETIELQSGHLIIFYTLLSSKGCKEYKHKYPLIS